MKKILNANGKVVEDVNKVPEDGLKDKVEVPNPWSAIEKALKEIIDSQRSSLIATKPKPINVPMVSLLMCLLDLKQAVRELYRVTSTLVSKSMKKRIQVQREASSRQKFKGKK